MSAVDEKSVLVIGFGNPAREDDGLGPAAASVIEKLGLNNVTVDADYQLTVEDSADVAQHDTVIFVDASVSGKEPFSFSQLIPEKQESFSSHSVRPEAVLGLAKDLFNAGTEAYMLGIRGYSFNMFKEVMTEKALDNLEKAVHFLMDVLHSKDFHKAIDMTHKS